VVGREGPRCGGREGVGIKGLMEGLFRIRTEGGGRGEVVGGGGREEVVGGRW
jgi:hypothetical protein